MNSRLAAIPIVLDFALVIILESLDATGRLHISNTFLVIAFFVIVSLSIIINRFAYKQNIMNHVIIIVSVMGYVFMLCDMLFFKLFDNNETFIHVNKILFLSFLPLSIKIKQMLEGRQTKPQSMKD